MAKRQRQADERDEELIEDGERQQVPPATDSPQAGKDEPPAEEGPDLFALLEQKFPHAHPKSLADGLARSLRAYPDQAIRSRRALPLHVQVTPDTVFWLGALVEILEASKS